MVRLWTSYSDIQPMILYDVLHDPEYRSTWDENIMEGFLIERLDENNDVGYYSAKVPFGLSNRDFVNRRSWRVKGNKQYIIMNHSVVHPAQPERKGFVRAWSYRAGYLIQSREEGGCTLTFVAHIDPRGWIPHYVVNKIATLIAPNIVEKLAKATKGYELWKQKNQPNRRPWRTLCEILHNSDTISI